MVKSVKKYTLITLATGLMSFIVSPTYAAEEDGRAWLNLQVTGQTAIKNLGWNVELQSRERQELRERDQFFFRPSLMYAIAPKTSLWLGYAYVNTEVDNPLLQDEHRTWEQLKHEFEPIGSIRLRSWTRLEQRKFESAGDIGHKIRQWVAMNIPFAHYPNLSTLISNEYHHNLNSTDYGARSGFDQNRLFVGLAWQTKEQNLIEIGYLNQYINRHNIDAMNHVLATTFYYHF